MALAFLFACGWFFLFNSRVAAWKCRLDRVKAAGRQRDQFFTGKQAVFVQIRNDLMDCLHGCRGKLQIRIN
jgi:hypothetical protein